MGDGVAHSLEKMILRVDTIHTSLICIRVILICLFMPHFSFLKWANPATVITLSRVVVNIRERHIQGLFSLGGYFRSIKSFGYTVVPGACYKCRAFDHFSRECPWHIENWAFSVVFRQLRQYRFELDAVYRAVEVVPKVFVEVLR